MLFCVTRVGVDAVFDWNWKLAVSKCFFFLEVFFVRSRAHARQASRRLRAGCGR